MKFYRKVTIKDEKLFEKKMTVINKDHNIKNYRTFVEEFLVAKYDNYPSWFHDGRHYGWIYFYGGLF